MEHFDVVIVGGGPHRAALPLRRKCPGAASSFDEPHALAPWLFAPGHTLNSDMHTSATILSHAQQKGIAAGPPFRLLHEHKDTR